MKKLWISFCLTLVLLFACLLFSACDKDDLDDLLPGGKSMDPQNISYDSINISWDRVADADHYLIRIGDGEDKRVNTNVYGYDAKGTSFDVTVTTVKGEDQYAASAHFTYLEPVEELRVSNSGTISWDATAGADAYLVSVDGKTVDGTVTDTTYAGLTPGSHRVKVKPVVAADKTYYSVWSAEKSLQILGAPANLQYDGAELTWNGVSGAVHYLVSINGREETTTQPSYLYSAGAKDFSVSVKAIGNHTSSYDSAATKDSWMYLDPATNMHMEDGILKWDASAKAEGYRIKVNGTVQKNTLTAAEYDGLSSGISQRVSVLPIRNSGNFFSDWTEEMSVYILKTPQVSWNADLQLDGQPNNNFIWQTVEGASGYTVRVTHGGVTQEYPFGEDQRFYANAYTEAGIYRIEVKATAAAGSDYSDSRYSTVTTVERLAAPTAASRNYIVSDPSALAAGFTVTFNPVSGAKGYQVWKDGVALPNGYVTGTQWSDRSVVAENVTEQQEINYKICSVGSVVTTSAGITVRLGSLTDEASALSFKITVLAMPRNARMEGYDAKWDAVSGARGYAIGYGGESLFATSTMQDLSTLPVGTSVVRICATGDGAMTLASNLTAPMTIQRLAAPTHIRITSASEGTLLYDPVPYAKGYRAYLGTDSNPVDENNYDNMYQFIKETGTTLHMYADANYYNEECTVYYMTSPSSDVQQFIRLAAPVFPEGAFSVGTQLRWNASANINTAEYTPTYEVYFDGQEHRGNMNATVFNISTLDGGRSYTFTVKAIGNDSKYLDSEMSAPIEIFKLATPKLFISDNAYHWSVVSNAAGYALYIDGNRVTDEIHVTGGTYTYIPRYTTTGNHTVVLKAIGDGGHATIDSDDYTYTQVVRQLNIPEITFTYSHEQVTRGGFFTVTITTPSAHANGYLYEIAGDTITPTTALSATKTVDNVGSVTARVKALGGLIDEDEIYYIDSQYVGGNAAYTILLLGTPELQSFKMRDNAVSWKVVGGASGYDWQVSYDGGAFSEVEHSGSAALNPIENLNDYHSVTFRVRASGSADGKTISSEWVEYTWTNPNK